MGERVQAANCATKPGVWCGVGQPGGFVLHHGLVWEFVPTGRQRLQVKAGLGSAGPALIWERLEESPLHLRTGRHICELCGDIAQCI